MAKQNAKIWLSVFILLASGWLIVLPEVATAQTDQGNYVVRDPAASASFKVPFSKTKTRSTPRNNVIERIARSQNYLPSNWSPRVVSVRQEPDQEENAQQQENANQDAIDSLDEDENGLDPDEDQVDDDKQFRAGGFESWQWPPKSIRNISVNIVDDSPVIPRDRSSQLTDLSDGNWFFAFEQRKVFAWTAPNIRYQPLYFQNVPLERYGQTCGGLRQIGASGFHFFTSTVRLPYAMIVDPRRSCDYPLGFCRPGNPAPLTTERILYPR